MESLIVCAQELPLKISSLRPLLFFPLGLGLNEAALAESLLLHAATDQAFPAPGPSQHLLMSLFSGIVTHSELEL